MFKFYETWQNQKPKCLEIQETSIMVIWKITGVIDSNPILVHYKPKHSMHDMYDIFPYIYHRN